MKELIVDRISRRTLAKGATWAIPAVVIASPAPAFATSPTGLSNTSTFTQYIQMQPGSRKPYFILSADTANPQGSTLAFALGRWNLPANTPFATSTGQKIDGFYAIPGYCGVSDCTQVESLSPEFNAAIKTADGTVYSARAYTNQPGQCAIHRTQGETENRWSVTLKSALPYFDPFAATDPRSNLESKPVAISIPFSLIPLSGNTPIHLDGAESSCMYFNATFAQLPDGNYSKIASQYSFSATPLI